MRTGKQFLESINDGRVVWVGNEKIDNLATHPLTKDYAQRHADFYDLHHRPELQDVLTFVDKDGVRRSKQWMRQHNKEEMQQKRLYTETVLGEIGGSSFGRLPDSTNQVLIAYEDDPEPWSKQSVGTNGRDLTKHIADFIKMARDQDLNCPPAFIAPQVDRADPSAHEKSPNVRLISTNDEGIIVHGVKGVSTGAHLADYIHLGVFYQPGLPGDQIIFAMVPPATKGISILCRENTGKTDPVEHPLASLGDELDCTVVFENVFIPWSRVIHIGNPDHARLYPQRIFDWVHLYIMIRQTMRAELIAGLGILICESLGTNKIPAVQARVAKLIQFHQTMLAHLTASIDLGFMSPGGSYKPNTIMVQMGRAHYLTNIQQVIFELLDLSGRAPIMIPTEKQWSDPHYGKWFVELARGPKHEPRDRVQVSRVIRDLFMTDWGDRITTFENFNGTPIFTVLALTMQRAEMSGAGPYAKLARKICAINVPGSDEYEKTAEYGRAQDAALARPRVAAVG